MIANAENAADGKGCTVEENNNLKATMLKILINQ